MLTYILRGRREYASQLEQCGRERIALEQKANRLETELTLERSANKDEDDKDELIASLKVIACLCICLPACARLFVHGHFCLLRSVRKCVDLEA
jgi:hypothetical protein